jgi:hypothetical protein
MKTLYELLKLRNNANGLFGIEIEVEGDKLPGNCPPQWNIVDDGSLRGRFPDQRSEFVLRKPLGKDEAIQSVNDLKNHLDKHNAVLEFSFRTSVHVHVNVQDMNINQYLNMLYTYLLLENALVRYCGDERIANRFCLRLQDAEGFTQYLTELFRNGVSTLARANVDALKYASVNIAATPKYGSLEFRAMQGNLSPKYIETWILALNNIREYALKMKNPQAVHDDFVRMSPSKFMEKVLGDTYGHFSYEEEADDMRMAFSLTLQLPYSFMDELTKRKVADENRAKQIAKLEAKMREDMEKVKQQVARRIKDIEDLNLDDPAAQEYFLRADDVEIPEAPVLQKARLDERNLFHPVPPVYNAVAYR